MILWCASAFGSLGAQRSSVEGDPVNLNGSIGVQVNPLYAVHANQNPSGTVVKEYVLPDGRVFAVAWEGPSLPDFRQLLGSYFVVFVDAVNRQNKGPGSQMIDLPDLVVHSGGRMRAFFGQAYLPRLLPTGVRPEDLQ